MTATNGHRPEHDDSDVAPIWAEEEARMAAWLVFALLLVVIAAVIVVWGFYTALEWIWPEVIR